MIASVISSFKEVCSMEVQINGEKAVDKPQRVCLFFKSYLPQRICIIFSYKEWVLFLQKFQ